MRTDELKAAFDQQAPTYDKQWSKLAPIRDALHFLLESVFAELPSDAKVLCVGAGTGVELAHLATRFPRWTFTVVEPSTAMIALCRRRAASDGFAARCQFHEGYVEALPRDPTHHAATCLLVSQFIVDQGARTRFFREIASRLQPGGVLASSDLSADVGSQEFESLVRAWMHMMSGADVSDDAIERMRAAWKKDVAILPPSEVAAIIQAGGFEPPVEFFQAGLIHAWFAKREPD